MAVVAIKDKKPQYDYGEYGPQVNIGGRIVSKPGSDLGPKGGTQSVDTYLKLLSEYGLTDTDYTGKKGISPGNLIGLGAGALDVLTGGAVKKKGDALPDYRSPYSSEIEALLNAIQNRGEFSYDVEADPLYQQYQAGYRREGDRAMRDTMGNAAALTGGYGSSYGTTAGSQAFDYYLGKLNDRVPELEQLAYKKYQNEGNALYDELSAYQGLEDRAYDRYRDEVSDYYENLAQQNWMDEFLYGKEKDSRAQQNFLDQFLYGKEKDALSQKNWQATYEQKLMEAEREQKNWQEEQAYKKQQDALSNTLARQKANASANKTQSAPKHSELYESVLKRAVEMLDKGKKRPDEIASWVGNQRLTTTETDTILRYLGLF